MHVVIVRALQPKNDLFDGKEVEKISVVSNWTRTILLWQKFEIVPESTAFCNSRLTVGTGKDVCGESYGKLGTLLSDSNTLRKPSLS